VQKTISRFIAVGVRFGRVLADAGERGLPIEA
jgi:hypothetical protein